MVSVLNSRCESTEARAWVWPNLECTVAQMVTGKVSHTVQNKDISSQTPGRTQRLDMALSRATARDLLRVGTSVCFEASGPHAEPITATQLRGGSFGRMRWHPRKQQQTVDASPDLEGYTRGPVCDTRRGEPEALVRARQGSVVAKKACSRTLRAKQLGQRNPL